MPMKGLSKISIFAFAVAFGLIFSSCSNKITEEQLLQLRELRKQERSLTEMLSKKRDDKAKLERELNSRKAELKECEDKNNLVKERLAKWPDVWPDWKPAPPVEEQAQPAEAPTKKIRKK